MGSSLDPGWGSACFLFWDGGKAGDDIVRFVDWDVLKITTLHSLGCPKELIIYRVPEGLIESGRRPFDEHYFYLPCDGGKALEVGRLEEMCTLKVGTATVKDLLGDAKTLQDRGGKGLVVTGGDHGLIGAEDEVPPPQKDDVSSIILPGGGKLTSKMFAEFCGELHAMFEDVFFATKSCFDEFLTKYLDMKKFPNLAVMTTSPTYSFAGLPIVDLETGAVDPVAIAERIDRAKGRVTLSELDETPVNALDGLINHHGRGGFTCKVTAGERIGAKTFLQLVPRLGSAAGVSLLSGGLQSRLGIVDDPTDEPRFSEVPGHESPFSVGRYIVDGRSIGAIRRDYRVFLKGDINKLARQVQDLAGKAPSSTTGLVSRVDEVDALISELDRSFGACKYAAAGLAKLERMKRELAAIRGVVDGVVHGSAVGGAGSRTHLTPTPGPKQPAKRDTTALSDGGVRYLRDEILKGIDRVQAILAVALDENLGLGEKTTSTGRVVRLRLLHVSEKGPVPSHGLGDGSEALLVDYRPAIRAALELASGDGASLLRPEMISAVTGAECAKVYKILREELGELSSAGLGSPFGVCCLIAAYKIKSGCEWLAGVEATLRLAFVHVSLEEAFRSSDC